MSDRCHTRVRRMCTGAGQLRLAQHYRTRMRPNQSFQPTPVSSLRSSTVAAELRR